MTREPIDDRVLAVLNSHLVEELNTVAEISFIVGRSNSTVLRALHRLHHAGLAELYWSTPPRRILARKKGESAPSLTGLSKTEQRRALTAKLFGS